MCVRGKPSPTVPCDVKSVFSSHVLDVLTLVLLAVLLQSIRCLRGVCSVAQSDLGQTWCCESPVRLDFLTRTLSEELQLCHFCTVHCCCEPTAHPGESLSKALGLFVQACLVCKQQRTILPLWEASPGEAVIYLCGGAGSWWCGAAGVVLSACRPGWSHKAVCRVWLLFVKGDRANESGEVRWLSQVSPHSGWQLRPPSEDSGCSELGILWKSLWMCFGMLSALAAVKPGWGRVWRQAELKQGDSYTTSSWLLWAPGVHITFAHVVPWHSRSVCSTDWNCDHSQ